MAFKSLALALICLVLSCEGFFKAKTYKDLKTYIANSHDELATLLCTKVGITMKLGGSGSCDSEPKKILIKKQFVFTNQETKTEPACRHQALGNVCPSSLWKLKSDVSTNCENDVVENKKFSAVGLAGLPVGSNKIIIGIHGGGLIGAGLRLEKVTNVEIRNLAITDINPHLYKGGSGIELIGVKNVLIDGNYFKDIGYSMIGSKGASSTGVTISSNLFDGRTSYSFDCDGRHSYVWLFTGEGDRIRLQHNTVMHTGGRSPLVDAAKNAKTVVHLFKNIFLNIKNTGVIHMLDKESSILVEGNLFNNVSTLVDQNTIGNVFMSQTESDEVACEAYINRRCDVSTVHSTDNAEVSNSVEVLNDIKAIYDADNKSWRNWLG